MKIVALLLLLVVLHAAFGGYVEEEEVKRKAGGKPYCIYIPISTIFKHCHNFRIILCFIITNLNFRYDYFEKIAREQTLPSRL